LKGWEKGFRGGLREEGYVGDAWGTLNGGNPPDFGARMDDGGEGVIAKRGILEMGDGSPTRIQVWGVMHASVEPVQQTKWCGQSRYHLPSNVDTVREGTKGRQHLRGEPLKTILTIVSSSMGQFQWKSFISVS
jgi:hypothetical protein